MDSQRRGSTAPIIMTYMPVRPLDWGCANCDYHMHKEEEELCQCCGQYFCIPCFDEHECEPCEDCGQTHITEGCQAAPI